jgi:hypothetical protein
MLRLDAYPPNRLRKAKIRRLDDLARILDTDSKDQSTI